MNLQTFQTVADYVLRIITLLVAAAGVYTAAQGLYTWRRQIHGQFHFELARKMAKNALILRDLITWCRIGMYDDNWQDLSKRSSEALVELSTCALEAETPWGEEIATAMRRLREQLAEYWVSAHGFFEMKAEQKENPSRHSDEAGIQEFARLRKVVFGIPGDDFDLKVKAALDGVIAVVKPHLIQQQS